MQPRRRFRPVIRHREFSPFWQHRFGGMRLSFPDTRPQLFNASGTRAGGTIVETAGISQKCSPATRQYAWRRRMKADQFHN
jgi:hypothetical protein